MVQNINPVTFQSFGTILSEKASTQELSLTYNFTPEPGAVYHTTAPTWLRCEGNLAVLSVALQDGQFRDLYLDKTVCLNAGLDFSLSFLEQPCPVLTSQIPQAIRHMDRRPDFTVRPQMQVSRLYTFFYQEKERGFFFPGEAHPMAELTYVDQGSLHTVTDGQDLLLHQGDLTVYCPNQFHTQYADVNVAPRFITLSFRVDNYDLSPLMGRKFSSNAQISALLTQMLREQELSDAHSADMILSCLNQLLLILLRQATTHPQTHQTVLSSASENRIVSQALRYISDNVRMPLSVPLVARGANVSPSYLTSLFHKHLQISPGEYIRRVRLQESKQLIREGELNFTQIAQILHYSTVHHFSRQFKEKFGLTPSQYARSVK